MPPKKKGTPKKTYSKALEPSLKDSTSQISSQKGSKAAETEKTLEQGPRSKKVELAEVGRNSARKRARLENELSQLQEPAQTAKIKKPALQQPGLRSKQRREPEEWLQSEVPLSHTDQKPKKRMLKASEKKAKEPSEDLSYLSRQPMINYKSFSSAGKRTRQENGLVELTKKFIDLIKGSEGQCIDLNDAVDDLQVQKRRIYDITNVLEGIGLIEKYKKNKIKWTSLEEDQQKLELLGQLHEDLGEEGEEEQHSQLENDEDQAQLVEELLNIEREEAELDFRQKRLDSEMIQLQIDPVYNQFAYVSYADLEKLQEANSRRSSGTEKGLKSSNQQNSTLIAIRAPPGSVLDVTNYQNLERLRLKAEQEQASPQEIEAITEYLTAKFHIMIQSDPNEIKDDHSDGNSDNSEKMFNNFQGSQKQTNGMERQIQVYEILRESREVRKRVDESEVKQEEKKEEEKNEFSPLKWQQKDNLLIPSSHSPFRANRFSNLNTPLRGQEDLGAMGNIQPRILDFGGEKKEEAAPLESLLCMYQEHKS